MGKSQIGNPKFVQALLLIFGLALGLVGLSRMIYAAGPGQPVPYFALILLGAGIGFVVVAIFKAPGGKTAGKQNKRR